MKLCDLKVNNEYHFGVRREEHVINITELLKEYPNAEVPETLEQFIKDNTDLELLTSYIETIGERVSQYAYKEETCNFAPVISQPEKIICIGLNYRKHADETGMPYPDVPILFSKFNNALAGHNEVINIPEETKKLDYEAELAVVIGKTAKDVTESEALDYVFGYTLSNDLSARDLQMRTGQWLLGKTSDGFAPVGPFITTRDEVSDPQNLNIKTEVNGVVRQNSNTADMIFYCREIISYVSKHMTLKPGDIILTGTPEGVAMGLPEAEQEFLKAGDEVVIEIEGLGRLKNYFN